MLRRIGRLFGAGADRSAASTSPAPPPAASDAARAVTLLKEGNRQEDAGDLDGALALYLQAASAVPELAEAHLNVGIALASRGDSEGAAAAYERVLALDADHPFGNYNYARLRFIRGKLDDAETLCRTALRVRPDLVDASILLASVLEATGRPIAAVETLDQALEVEPDRVGAWYNQALLLRGLGRLEDAHDAADHAFALDPDSIDVLRLRGLLAHDEGLTDEALAAVQAAIAREPGDLALRSSELLLLNCIEGIDAADLYERHAAYGIHLESAHPARFAAKANHGEASRRLRIGYVSGDFCVHPVTLFLLPLLEHHDRSKFEVVCYSSTTATDHITERVVASCDRWVDAAHLSDAELADAIYADEIDVLVDLSGHTGRGRLSTFAERPAPLQVAWLGYLNTTGLKRIDARLTDRRCDPPESSQPLHTEKLALLPESQWCYRPLVDAAPVLTPPLQRNGFATFGSFNGALKITPGMLERWMSLLARLPGSRLVIANVGSERKRDSIRAAASRWSIDESRIAFLSRVDLDVYLQLFGQVDIALDTFPYGGGTTTFDALWMGVPVVTAVGETPVSRSAASVLAAVGLDEWIAPTVDDYVEVALRRAVDHTAIASLRTALRARLQASPLTDIRRFTRSFEHEVRSLWNATRV